MVEASTGPIQSEKIHSIELPIIDLSGKRSEVSKLIVKACEEFGFFKVINHGVPNDVITKMEDESLKFFSKQSNEKQRAGPPNPYGYGSKNIGFNGDIGEVEYLLLNINNPLAILEGSKIFSNEPSKFSTAVSGYVAAVRRVACEILDLLAEGLWVPQHTSSSSSVFSKLIRAVDSDSLFRLNYYPSFKDKDTSSSSSSSSSFRQQHHHYRDPHNNKIGFGEHSDPQILTLLKSNDVGGLQISLHHGVWVPVSPDPTSFCVNVGDVLQAMTNGRFISVRHRALVNSNKSRLSMVYFGAPPLHARITSPPELVQSNRPNLYRPFTWAEYKEATYSLRLGDTRLNLFRVHPDNEITE